MDAEDAARRAIEAVPGDGPAARACRQAVAHVLYLDDDDHERDRWRSNLAQCEAALLDGTSPPRPGLVNVDVAHALAEAERSLPAP
jgi:hypothetical protein